jgi:hypothetical protein
MYDVSAYHLHKLSYFLVLKIEKRWLSYLIRGFQAQI